MNTELGEHRPLLTLARAFSLRLTQQVLSGPPSDLVSLCHTVSKLGTKETEGCLPGARRQGHLFQPGHSLCPVCGRIAGVQGQTQGPTQFRLIRNATVQI